MIFKIGRGANNDFVITDESVSIDHAVIEFEEETVTLSDLNSKNGTFVNGIRIFKKIINFDESFRFGLAEISGIEIKTKINESAIEPESSAKINFSEEFNKLEDLYNEYQKKLNKLNRNAKNKPLMIRLVIIVVLMGAAWMVNKIFDIGSGFSSILVVGILAGIITNFISPSGVPKEKLEELEIEFSSKIACPKCKTSLLKKSWKYWKSKGGCPNSKCEASWD